MKTLIAIFLSISLSAIFIMGDTIVAGADEITDMEKCLNDLDNSIFNETKNVEKETQEKDITPIENIYFDDKC